MIINRRLGDRLKIEVNESATKPKTTHFMLQSDLSLACDRVIGPGDYSFQAIDGTSWTVMLAGEAVATASVVGPAKGRPRPCSKCRQKAAAKAAEAASTCPGA